MLSETQVQTAPTDARRSSRQPGVLLDRIGLMFLTHKHDRAALDDLLEQLCRALSEEAAQTQRSIPQAESLLLQQRFLLDGALAMLSRVRQPGPAARPDWWNQMEHEFDDFVEHYREHEADQYHLLLYGSAW